MQYTGTISNISSFDYQGKKLWSFQLNNERGVYYRCGATAPRAEQGNWVAFEGTPGKNGSVNVDTKSLVAKQVEKEASGVQIPAYQAKPTGVSKDDYWANREARDLQTQARIERQSTRNSAIDFIKILLEQGAIAFGEKVKGPQRVETLEKLLAHYQEDFIKDNSGEKEVVKEKSKAAKEEPSDEIPF